MIDFMLEVVFEENYLVILSFIVDDIGFVIVICNFVRWVKKFCIFCWLDISYDRKYFFFWSRLIVIYLRLLYIKENLMLFYEFIVIFYVLSVVCFYLFLLMYVINLDFINLYVIMLILKFFI